MVLTHEMARLSSEVPAEADVIVLSTCVTGLPLYVRLAFGAMHA